MLINPTPCVGNCDQLVAPSLHHFPYPKGIFRASQELGSIFRRGTTRVKNGNDFHGALLPTRIYSMDRQGCLRVRLDYYLL